MNLALAMAGECGEVCEIFQWKGNLDVGITRDKFTDKEITHIGEELADVFIYSTRLCEVCNIDLASATKHHVLGTTGIDPRPRTQSPSKKSNTDGNSISDSAWDDLMFSDLDKTVSEYLVQSASPRMYALSLQNKCGQVAALFSSLPETSCQPGLSTWAQSDLRELSTLMGSIVLVLACIAKIASISLDKCIADKFAKNEAKYPVSMSKGKSDKYTAYVTKPQNVTAAGTQMALTVLAFAGISVFSFIIGRSMGSK